VSPRSSSALVTGIRQTSWSLRTDRYQLVTLVTWHCNLLVISTCCSILGADVTFLSKISKMSALCQLSICNLYMYTLFNYMKLGNNLSVCFSRKLMKWLHRVCTHTCDLITKGSGSCSFLSFKKFFLVILYQFVQKLSVTCYENRVVCIWTLESISYFEWLLSCCWDCCPQLNVQ